MIPRLPLDRFGRDATLGALAPTTSGSMVFAELMRSLVAGKRGQNGWGTGAARQSPTRTGDRFLRVPTNVVAAAACPAVSLTRMVAVDEHGKASHCRYDIGDVVDDAVAKARSAPGFNLGHL